jgi:hypothetical protein
MVLVTQAWVQAANAKLHEEVEAVKEELAGITAAADQARYGAWQLARCS